MSNRPICTVIGNQKVLSVEGTSTVTQAARVMKEHKTGALLVCESGRLVGVFTERDALFRVTAEERDPHTSRS